MGILRRVHNCGCGRALRRDGTCPACTAANKTTLARAAKRGVDAAPHTCPKPGCGGTVRGGVCPDPRGVH